MPFIFCSDAFPPWRYSFLLLEKSGSCAVPRWHGCATRCKTFQRNFLLQLLPPLSGSGSSRAYSRDSPSSRFSIYLFFFFTTCYVIPRSNFPRFFPCPDFHGFLDIAGSTTFFFPFSSKMEGINTRHFNATSWPTFAK